MGLPYPPHRVLESSFKLRQVLRFSGGEGAVGLIANIFRRVEFWSISRKLFDMESRMVKKELLNFFPPVDSSPIPQPHHRAVKMREQISEERPDRQASETPSATPDRKGRPPSFRGHGKGADGRNSVLLVEMVKEGRLPFRSLGASDIGHEQKADFIEKNQMGPKSFGVFFIRGQRRRRQRWMAFSSRCGARRSGFWQLQPKFPKSFQTWQG
jgi:hypothetical protein